MARPYLGTVIQNPFTMAAHISSLALIFFFFASCGNAQQNGEFQEQQAGYDAQMMNDPNAQYQGGNNSAAVGNGASAQGGNDQIKMYPIRDQKTGMVSQQVPLPASWKVTEGANTNGPAITGPGGVKVYYTPGGTYVYSNDPYTQQSYQMAGVPMRAPVDMGTYLQQDLVPYMAKQGMRLVKQYPLPQVAAKNEAHSSQLFKSAPSRETHASLGSDWVNNKGEQTFVMVNMMTSVDQNGAFWNAYLQMLQAEPASMEQAKAALIYSVVNTQHNPQHIAAYNASQQQQTNQSWSQHNAQMQTNQRNFDQRQQSHRETQDHINKNSMDSYNSRMHTNDEIQRGFLNYINDENTVRDKSTGERYQVQSGADQYWMNNNNEYIQSNDAFYNPNMDQNVNNQQWQETEIEP